MSYILDALRKSEQERLRGTLPDLKNFGDDHANKSGRNRLAWIIGGALLSLNAIVLGIWLLRSSPTTEGARTVASVATNTGDAIRPVEAPNVAPHTTTQAGAATAPSSVAPSAATPASMAAATSPLSTLPPGTSVAAQGATAVLPNAGAVAAPPNVITQASGTVMTAAPAGTVYYVTPANPVAAQQVVVVPGNAIPGAIAPGSNVVVMPAVNQPVAQGWESASSGAVVPPPPAPPPPPVNLDQTLDAVGVSATPQVSYLPQMDELPTPIRQQIPDLAFSSHMFSSMAKFRSVVINGTRVKEGQQVGNLTVQEITETGVILSVGDTRFQVDVLGKWSQWR